MPHQEPGIDVMQIISAHIALIRTQSGPNQTAECLKNIEHTLSLIANKSWQRQQDKDIFDWYMGLIMNGAVDSWTCEGKEGFSLGFTLFIWKAERQREQEKEKESTYSTGSQMGHNNWTGPRPGDWNSIQVSHMNGRGWSTGTALCCLPRDMSRKLDWKQSS